MLTEYKGPANHHDLFKYMVGETITACFEADGAIWIVGSSGAALVLTTPSGRAGENRSRPSFWKEGAEEVEKITSKRRAEIEAQLAQLRDLPGVRLP